MGQIIDRKPARLQKYDYTRGNTVFVTICVEGRKNLLGKILSPETETDRPHIELSRIGQTADRYARTIPGIENYVIMPNHVHMLIRNAEGENISSKIRGWKFMITKEIGTGIWQRSFYDHVIRDEKDYLTKWQYIENNPSKWVIDRYYQA